MDASTWQDVGTHDPENVRDNRLALHHAAQVASSLGATHLEADDDHRYANLTWNATHRALLGRPVAGLQAGIRLWDGRWILVRGEEQVAKRSMAGSNREGALIWLADVVETAGGPEGPLKLPGYELPEHPFQHSGVFNWLDKRALAVIEAWFASADAVLHEVAASHEGSEVRCWPHHFDIATRIELNEESEDGRSVSVGMTPGDGAIGEPYWYVNAWPAPSNTEDLPELPHGRWNTEGWFGAVLTASDLPESDQGETVQAFLQAAIPACKELAGS